MLSPFVEELLTEYLQGLRTVEDARWILRNTDDGVYKGEDLLAEFNEVLGNISKKIPGLAINYEKLLANDPIECDPLVSQGNLALLRLDAIYYQAFTAWTKSGKDIHQIKIIRKPENPAKYTERTQQHIHTEENYPPDAQLLNQVVNIALSAFRVQATITHRRETLTNPPVSRDATRSASPPQQLSPSQPEASARNAAATEVIDHTEILDDSLDLIEDIKPFDGKISLIRGVNRIGPLKGIAELIPGLKSSPVGSAMRTETSAPNTKPFNLREEEPVTQDTTIKVSLQDSLSAPSASLRETQSETTSGSIPVSREEEPVVQDTTNKVSRQDSLSAPSASPRETDTFTHNQPAFHKRE